MGLKEQRVFLPESIKSALGKRAASEGKSASALAKEWIESALAHPSGSGGGGAGLDRESFQKMIGEAIGKALEKAKKERAEHEETQKLLAEMGLLPDPSPGPGLSPDVIRILLKTQTKLDSLLMKVFSHMELPGVLPAEREDWVKVAESDAREVLNNLNLGGEK